MDIKKGLARKKRDWIKATLKQVDRFFNTDYYHDYIFHLNHYHNPDFRFQKSEIAFVHVPKTGGTSFYKMLEGKNHNVVNLKLHRPISKHCSPTEYKYITIMRDPVKRVWSLYNMVLRSSADYPYKRFANDGLEKFLINCWEARNMTCRYFSGNVKKNPDKGTLQVAKKNLKQFYSVLAFGSFNEEVSRFFRNEKIPFEQVLHERKKEYTFPTEEEQRLIKKYNQLDMELYESWKYNL